MTKKQKVIAIIAFVLIIVLIALICVSLQSKNNADSKDPKASESPVTSAEPTPEPTPTPLQFTAAPEGYFNDALFIGDSRMVGIDMMQTIDGATFFTTVGMSLTGAMSTSADVAGVGTTTLPALLQSRQFGKIYVMLGINDIGGSVEALKQTYSNLVDKLRAAQPDAIIYIMSNLHVSATQDSRGTAVNNAQSCWPLALLAIAVIIVANIWGKGMIKIIPILLGVVIPYIVALVCGMVDLSGVGAESVVGLPAFTLAKFDITAILAIAPVAVAAMMEHIGDISAISATCGKNYMEDPGLHRTLLGDGLATAVAGLFGGPANTTYGENTGVLALSRVYDPNVVRLAAVYAVILSFSPQFDALVNSIPSAIVGGVSFILYGMISAVGVRNVVENRVDLTKSRNLIIAAVIMVCGLGFSNGITFQVGGAVIKLTALAIAAIAGVLLNAILPGNDYVFGTDAKGDGSANLGTY